MGASEGEKAPSRGKKKSFFREFLARLRKQRIIETLAAFIGGGWLLIEVVERLLVSHYGFPEKTIDLTVVSVIGALLSTLVWRWFRGTEKRPGNVKIEVLIIPLIILVTLAIDLNLIFQITSIQGKKLLIGIVAFLLGIAWIVFKSLQWAASTPDAAAKKLDISKLAEIKPEKSIVVLPFADISPQKDQEYFCDGMTEEIITDLSHVHDLLVISRSSAMTFKGTKKTIPEIARTVNVRYVLEGSVRKAGNHLRIATQLIDAEKDVHLWADKYSGTLDDVFDIQDKVSHAIVAGLKMRLVPGEERKIAGRPLASAPAYDCYLRAKQEIARWTEPSLDRALRHLESALEMVGDNAVLFAGVALVYLTYAMGVFRTVEETLLKAEEWAKKALQMDAELAPGHYVLGTIAYMRGDMRQAFIRTKHAVSISPDDPDAVLWFVHAAISVGKTSASRPFVEQLLQSDPLNCLTHVASAVQNFYEGQFKAALEAGRVAYELDPEGIFSRGWYVMPLIWNQRFKEAWNILDRWRNDMPGHAWLLGMTSVLHAIQGKKAESQALLTEQLLAELWNDTVAIWDFADVYALNGETEEALKWLEHGLDIGCINYPFLSQFDPHLENIRGEPRFKKLMERVKYEWEHFEV
jgi:non-specific serine/threonine protein kinase